MAILKREVIGNQTLLLGDCREIMGGLTFDALVTDSPYGIGFSHGGGGGKLARSTRLDHMPIIGDESPFDPAPLLALGVPTILWGGNHFADKLPASQSWLVWDKRCADYSNDQADCEMAWTNLGFPARMFRHTWNGMLRGAESKTPRVHPTQKPIALMEWCLSHVAGASRILDPYMGSATTILACQRLGRNGIGVKIDPAYFEAACRRVDEAARQPDLFIADKPEAPKQEQLL